MAHDEPVTAVVFDVLGTLLDETGGRIAALRAALPDLADRAESLAADWRDRVDRAMAPIAARERPFRPHGELERAALTELLAAHELWLPGPQVAELARFGHRIEPFPGVPEALAGLRAELPVVALTNAGPGQAAAVFEHVGWEWTAVVSAESVAAYKPDPRTYRRALEVLGLPAEQVLMVAAHPWDLDGAAREGLRTAFLDRGTGADGRGYDLVAPDLGALVETLLSGQPTSSSRRSRT
ncbi:haloacid dehalogenase type II [Modestobacter excelsi]|uniref:haloacid dehalogenase type II n=1 Tax=Modestobacter excelsi TaxID=2213161 RepID=UPI00110CEFAA|nr:haloacid dehalogenase type II [Modestobacter excelsi]